MSTSDDTIAGSYRLVEKLGEGGMGEIWIGEHVRLGNHVAVKLLLETLSSNQEAITRFFNEAKATAAIAHPGIVQVYDYGKRADGIAFMVMELLRGETVEARLARVGKLSELVAAQLGSQLAYALGAAHARLVVHRDLKPDNLFIVADPAAASGERIKVLDFGIAKLTAADKSSLTKTRNDIMMGTPEYMSPEQCRGANAADSRADIYSVGAVLFAMVVGRPPFQSPSLGEVVMAQLMTPAPAPSSMQPGISPQFDAIVLRCLEKDPAARFATMDELALALEALPCMLTSSMSGPGFADLLDPGGMMPDEVTQQESVPLAAMIAPPPPAPVPVAPPAPVAVAPPAPGLVAPPAPQASLAQALSNLTPAKPSPRATLQFPAPAPPRPSARPTPAPITAPVQAPLPVVHPGLAPIGSPVDDALTEISAGPVTGRSTWPQLTVPTPPAEDARRPPWLVIGVAAILVVTLIAVLLFQAA